MILCYIEVCYKSCKEYSYSNKRGDMRKDKKQIIGEPMTDEQVKAFLSAEPADNTPAPLHKLLRAYQSLRIEDFERFLSFFKEQGFAFDCCNEKGENFSQIIVDQRLAEPYLEAFKVIQSD